MKKTIRQLLIVLLLFTLILAACSSGNDDNDTPQATNVPAGVENDESMNNEEEMDEEMNESMNEEMDEEMDESMNEEMDEEMDESMNEEAMDEEMDESMDEEMMEEEPLEVVEKPAIESAADLRTALTVLLGEHVLLASSATDAALGGRDAEFEASASALDANSVELAGLIGVVYGAEAEEAFLALWRTHIGFFVDYTLGVAGDDEAMKEEARENLAGYGADFSAFLAGANPNIDPDAVEANLAEHVNTLTAVIDAQGEGDPETAAMMLRHAYGHMSMTGLALSDAIATQFPDAFPGQAGSPAGDLRIALNTLLAEHTYIAANATNAALSGREADFEAHVSALDANTLDLGAAIGSVYGEEAEEAFVPLWDSHIGFFVDYTLGVAGDDKDMKDQAIQDLLGYRADFIAFLNGANPALTEDALSPILTPHVSTLTTVIEAQGAENWTRSYDGLRIAYAHMQLIADPLSGAISAQFPETFPDEVVEADAGAVTSATGAVDLRTALTNLLGEHVLLAASATGSALDGRTDDFEASAAALDENSVALSEAVGSVYGDEAGEAFLALWRTHIGFFVDYTTGVATDDDAMQAEALENLAGYGADFSAFLAGANPNIDPAAVEENLELHVNTLVAVINAQGMGDHEMAYENLRHAYAHMSLTGLALSDAIATQFPETFDGMAGTPAGDLRIVLNQLLAEHTYLAAMATDAALNGRNEEFEASASALDDNTVDLGAAIGSVYGEEAEEAFVPLWRSHIGFFVDYTLGVAGDDQAMKDQAIDDLLGYRADFIAFLSGANPALTEEALTPILTPHVGTLTAVIDAQGADDPMTAYTALREAYGHMQMIADPLAEAIVQQFPTSFAFGTIRFERVAYAHHNLDSTEVSLMRIDEPAGKPVSSVTSAPLTSGTMNVTTSGETCSDK